MRLVWDQSAWEDYVYWRRADRAVLRRVNRLIDAVLRDPCEGIGRPERLRYGAPGESPRSTVSSTSSMAMT
ncbi:hypothetical protein AIF0345_2812 [Actinomyces israelii]|nr:hypothetical protein AIF0345_2812 [Actinomyces israelii]